MRYETNTFAGTGGAHAAEAMHALSPFAVDAPETSSYFCRAFKDTFGDPPHAYIMRRRVERAQTLMLQTREPLSQIALACGLSDQAHLCNLFRRLVGQSPSHWRSTQWHEA